MTTRWRIARHAVALLLCAFGASIPGRRSAAQEAGTAPPPDVAVLDELAVKCGSEVDWAKDWNDAAARARREKRPLLVYARSMGGFAMTDAVMANTFMDPDVVELVQAKFVPLRVVAWNATPLRDRERYGLSRTTLGAVLVVCSPEGDVHTELASFEPSFVYRALGAWVRARRPARKGAPPITLKEARKRARDGDSEGALEIIDQLGDVTPARFRARVLRRMGEGERALAALQRKSARRAPAVDIDLDAALIHLRMGNCDEAMERLVSFLRSADRSHERGPEALYHLGACARLQRGNVAGAEEPWSSLVRLRPASRWAWKAAAQLRGTAWQVGSGERVEWPGERLLEAMRPAAPAPLALGAAARAHADALRYLLEQQREDGSWACPAESGIPAGEPPHAFTRAITAICAGALIPHAEDSDAQRAVTRAITFLDDAWSRVEAAPPRRGFMDYRPWADAYEIRFHAHAIDAGIGDAARHRERIGLRAAQLGELQKVTGGWSYYLGHDLTRAAVADQSISFTTAAAVRAFGRALDVGAPLPDGSFARGAAALAKMRYDETAFSYFLQPGHDRGKPSTRRPGAAGRGAACDLALIRAGKADLGHLRRSLALFFGHDELLAREAGKALMHCGEDAQGSHYVLFDYANVAEGIALLPEKEREAPRRRLLELLLRTRTEDGAFVDNPVIGRAFGAGMALRAFQALGVPAARER